MAYHGPHYIWMVVTQDKYELPLAIADTAAELAEMIGTTKNAVVSGVAHYERGRQTSRYRKVRADE